MVAKCSAMTWCRGPRMGVAIPSISRTGGAFSSQPGTARVGAPAWQAVPSTWASGPSNVDVLWNMVPELSRATDNSGWTNHQEVVILSTPVLERTQEYMYY